MAEIIVTVSSPKVIAVTTSQFLDRTSVCADATAVLKDTAGTTISSTDIASGASSDIEAPDGSVRVQYANGTLIESVIVKSNGSETANVPNPTTPLNTANPIKTGQTTSYATGDDGDLQEGRLTDFTTLDWTNPFGNTNRFTDELGGQDYVNGIFIDWSSYNQVDETVIGYTEERISFGSWSAALSGCNSYSVGIYTSGWRLPNLAESMRIFSYENAYDWDADIPNLTVNKSSQLWTSNTRYNDASQAYVLEKGLGRVLTFAKGGNVNYRACRTFTRNGTSLT